MQLKGKYISDDIAALYYVQVTIMKRNKVLLALPCNIYIFQLEFSIYHSKDIYSCI